MALNIIHRICVLIGFLVITNVLGQDRAANISSSCGQFETCRECITSDPKCAWCKDEKYDRDPLAPRCDVYSNLLSRCNTIDIINPGNRMNPIRADDLSGSGDEPAIQLTPQEVELWLRPGLPYDLNLNFQQAEDYPVDLYYLMDLSKSMEDDKDKLAQLGDLLAQRMSSITKNFRLGFGSFVDKVVMPYVSTVPEKLLAPCTKCEPPYGFRNHMNLSIETYRFKRSVAAAKVSGNLDAPEGGFDAIMQSMACESIGWRPDSRKLLVFSTDSGFHYAGDGKLGGIVKPNDGHCYLDDNGLYTASTTMDYPSLSQINQKARSTKMILIFAVTESQLSVYQELSRYLEGSTTGKLENDSSNVVDLIQQQYNKITSSVVLKDTIANDDIQVSYFSPCLTGKKPQNTNKCDGLRVGSKIPFTAKIEVKKCPKNRADWKQSFDIYSVGLTEKLSVKVNMLCECDCERTGIPNHQNCSQGHGTLQCGICSCNPNRYGRLCECDESNKRDDEDSLCKAPNSTLVCSGRGMCNCGRCSCFVNKKGWEGIYGAYCQCDNQGCSRHDGKLCNGHGDCVCNECKCHEGWTDSVCKCRTSNETCIGPDGLICSGFGTCECGRCKCMAAAGERRSGQFCDECPTCKGKCDFYRPCVQCQVFQSGDLDEEQCKECPIKPEVVDKAEVINDGEQLCIFKDTDDCKFTFVYGYDNESLPYIRVQRTKDCPPPVNVLMIVLGVIGGIVAIGLCLLLIWKLLTTIHDRREFAKFEKERQMAKWDTGENPIFKQATSTFKNPTYGGK